MSVSVSDRFASSLKTVEEVPEPFRHTLLQHLSPQHRVRLLVWGPASKTIRSKSPATLLTVTNRGWIVVSETQNDNTAVAHSDFANTLLVELTSILLCGRLKIDYIAEDSVQFISIEFNTVMQRLYQEAVQQLLDGMDDISASVPVENRHTNSLFDMLPFKFRNAVLDFSPRSQMILSVMHLPAIFHERNRWIQHELNPQSVLVLTERELMLISEEEARSWLLSRRTNKYGSIVTYCPLSRLEGFGLGEHRQIGSLDLDIRPLQGDEKLRIHFPHKNKLGVSAFMERTMKQKTDIRCERQ